MGDEFRIRLTYDRASQEDAYAEANSVWGGLEILFNPMNLTCSASWVGDDPSEEDEGNRLISIEAIGYRDDTARTKVSRMVTTRPSQTDLRKALLALDEACVLSGETQAESLEAAHILPVAENGTEEIENAILLRADLHRLFDAGMFWFSVCDEKASIRISDELGSTYYRQLLDGMALPTEVFARTYKRLKLREKLIDAE